MASPSGTGISIVRDDKDNEFETRSNISLADSCLSANAQAERQARVARLETELEYKRLECAKLLEIEKQKYELEQLRIKREVDATMAEMRALGTSPKGSGRLIDGNLNTVEEFPSQAIQATPVSQLDQSFQPMRTASKLSLLQVEQPQTSLESSLSRLAELISRRKDSRLPALEPEVFGGDRLQFYLWLNAFESFVESKVDRLGDCLHYLQRYTAGEARDTIKGFMAVRTDDSYRRAKALLIERYGDQLTIFNEFRDNLYKWPKIVEHDGKALTKFSDYLQYCLSMCEAIPALKYLDDPRESQRLLQKLPSSVAHKWVVVVH